MNPIVNIALKDLRLVTRDRMGMFFMLAFPIMMGVLFGMIGVRMSSGEPSVIKAAIVDLDQSAGSRLLIDTLRANENMQLDVQTDAAARDQVRLGQRAAMIVIPPKYGETAGAFWDDNQPEIKIIRDPSRSAEAGMIQGFLMEASGALMGKRMRDPALYQPQIKELISQIDHSDESPIVKSSLRAMLGSLDQFFTDLAAAQKSSRQDGKSDSEFEFQLANVKVETITREPSQQEALTNKIRSPWDISFPSAMIWGVLGTVAGFAISLVRERSMGTLLRLRTAPIARWQILGGKALACFTTVILVMFVLTAIGFALGLRPKNNAMLAVAYVAIAVCFVGVMLTVSVIGKTEQAVGGAGWGANITMAMFGGGMIPLAFMPDFFASISNFSPVKWAILSLEGAIWREFSWSEMAAPLGILLAIGAAGSLFGVWMLRREN